MWHREIRAALQQAVISLGVSGDAIGLDYPADPLHGDFATNAALLAARHLQRPPLAVAEQIAAQLPKLDFIERVEVVKPGFINFFISPAALVRAARAIVAQGERWGTSDRNRGRRVVVEYSSPNIAKPFTIGHLRSTIIGDAIANVLSATGWTVYRDNHLGDWGTQFGKQIYAIKTWGSEADIENAQEPVKKLVDVYVKFHQEAERNPALEDEARAWSKKLEDGDPEARRLWQKCVDWSWREFERLYARLGVRFTENNGRGYGEAFFEDKMAPVIATLREKKLLTKSEGAQLVFFPIDTKLPPLMIVRNDGGTLYATRDLATDQFRLQHYGSGIMVINETGVEQSLYFQQLYKLEEILGWYQPGRRVHVKHGHWRFKDRKMSTRKGDIIWLENVMNEAVARADALMTNSGTAHNLPASERRRLAEIVGVGALKWNDLKSSPQIDIVFQWDEVLNMQGNASPYVQYTYARARSILEAAGDGTAGGAAPAALAAEELAILRWLPRYPEAVADAAERYALNGLCTYVHELAQRFNSFYVKHSVLKAATPGERALRLLLTAACATTLKNGLWLLGITAPERM